MFSTSSKSEKVFEELERNRKLNLNIQLNQNQKLEDIYALDLLQPLLAKSYLPFTASSMRPINLVHILNNIFFNNCHFILEFGLGISSVLIGRLIQLNKIEAEIFSVEHDIKWIDKITHILKLESLDSIVKIIHAPLVTNDYHDLKWYNIATLDQHISEKELDLVIIDGPPAFQAEKRMSRYPAVPYTIDKLSEKAIIYLDDVHREGEKQILKMWANLLDHEFKLVNSTLAQYKRGADFDDIIFGY